MWSDYESDFDEFVEDLKEILSDILKEVLKEDSKHEILKSTYTALFNLTYGRDPCIPNVEINRYKSKTDRDTEHDMYLTITGNGIEKRFWLRNSSGYRVFEEVFTGRL
jgi:hypothetical protein